MKLDTHMEPPAELSGEARAGRATPGRAASALHYMLLTYRLDMLWLPAAFLGPVSDHLLDDPREPSWASRFVSPTWAWRCR